MESSELPIYDDLDWRQRDLFPAVTDLVSFRGRQMRIADLSDSDLEQIIRIYFNRFQIRLKALRKTGNTKGQELVLLEKLGAVAICPQYPKLLQDWCRRHQSKSPKSRL